MITWDELKAAEDYVSDQLGPAVNRDNLIIMFFTKIADNSQVKRTNLDKLLETHRELVIDCLSGHDTNIAVFPNGEVVACDGDKDCEDCIFFYNTDSCIDAARKWLKKECED